MRSVNVFVSAAFAAAVVNGTVCSDQIAGYDAARGNMPTDVCWEYSSNGGVAPPFNNGSAAVLGPTNQSGYHYWHRNLPAFSTVDGASITGSVRVNSSSYYFDGSYKRTGYYLLLTGSNGVGASLGIASDRVLLQIGDVNPADLTYAFNSTDAFHTYQLELMGSVATVKIDGNTVLVAPASIGAPTQARAYFGDISVLGNSSTQTAWVSVEATSECSPADFNCDDNVDGADLGQLLGVWNTNDCVADLNHDGIVDGGDLGILLGSWQ